MDTSRMIPGHSGWGYGVLGPHRQASLKMKEYWFNFEYVEVRSADKIFSGCLEMGHEMVRNRVQGRG